MKRSARSSVHLLDLQFGAIINKAAVTVCPPVSVRTYIFFFLWPILRKWAHWVICYMCVKFYEKQPNCFPKWLDLPAFSSVSSVQSLSHVQLFATPWTAAARLPCLSPTPGAFFKLMSIESVMPSNHLILCRPLLLLPSIFLSIRVFSSESVLCISGLSTRAPTSASVLPMNIQDWFPLGWTGWISLQSKGLSRVFSNTTVEKHQFFGA